MRVAWIFILLIISSGVANAQAFNQEQRIFHPFKVDVGINLTFPTDPNLTIGGGAFAEARYGIDDQWHVGLNLGSNILGEGQFILNNRDATITAQAIGNISLTGEYHFNTTNTRPFLGLAAGMYRRSDFEITDPDNGNTITNQGSIVNFGFAPRAGLMAGKFRMMVAYNFTGRQITNFISLGLGMQIGGNPYINR
ncbi:outer membrane beta-barrel protein [Litoribacter populi]|uniref:outer membrane beta-barrel protein n=1 Tax=Litoribacter populi TaxID=2598460 RepID=UPI00117DB73D|nr:outer membrane beta-barrel protein [Litoribacter populi]